LQGLGRGSLHSLTHTGSGPQQGVFKQTSPLRHCEPEVQVRKSVQQGCTQRLLPETVLMQAHVFLVFLHSVSQPAPRRGHVAAASAGLVNEASPTALTSDAPANRKARRREMLPLERPLANSSKKRPESTLLGNIVLLPFRPAFTASHLSTTNMIPMLHLLWQGQEGSGQFRRGYGQDQKLREK
jgi:hypothetical protein